MPALVLLISTQDSDSGDDDEDHSLLYTYSSNPHPSGSRVLKALALAAKGVLASICGEQANCFRLQHHGATVSMSAAHLQACMLVVVLPGYVDAQQGAHVAAMLADCLTLLAGPSCSWVAGLDPKVKGAVPRPTLKASVQGIADQLCEGLLSHLCVQGSAPGLLTPWLAFPGFLGHMQLPPHRQRLMEDVLQRHQGAAACCPLPLPSPGQLKQTGGAVLAAPHSVPTPGDCWQPTTVQLYRRSCCLMYRGVMVVSGLSLELEPRVWQCALCLGLCHQDVGPSAADEADDAMVWVLPTHMVAGMATDQHVQGTASPAACAATMARSHAPCTLVLAGWQGWVAAVVLQPWETTLDMQRVGQLEGVAAVEWLHQVHLDFGTEVSAAMRASSAWSTYDPAAAHTLAEQWAPASDHEQSGPGYGLAKSVATLSDDLAPSRPQSIVQTASPVKSPRRGVPGSVRVAPSFTTSPVKDPGNPGPVFHPSPSKARGVLARLLLNRGNQSGRRDRPSSPKHTAPTRVQSGLLPNMAWSERIKSGAARGTQSQAPRGPLSLGFLGSSTRSQGKIVLGQGVEDRNGKPQSGKLASHLGSERVGERGGVALPTKSAVKSSGRLKAAVQGCCAAWVLDLATGRLLVFLEDLPKDAAVLMAAAWPVLANCHQRLQLAATSTTTEPPKHSRLCLTLEQLDRLAALRAPPEAGLRLGHADSAPWQLHPELAPLTAAKQVTLEVPVLSMRTRASNAIAALQWYVTGQRDLAAGCEVLVLHSADVNEAGVMQQAKLLLEQYRVGNL